MDILRKKYVKSGGSGSCSSSSEAFNKLGFSKVVFAFLLLAFGMLAGWLVLLAELWVKRFVSPSPSLSASSSSLLRQLIFGRRKHSRWGEGHGSEWWGEESLRGRGSEEMSYFKGSGWMNYKRERDLFFGESARHKVNKVEPYLPHLKHLPP